MYFRNKIKLKIILFQFTSCPFQTNVTACVAGPSCRPFSTIAMRSHVAQAIADLHKISIEFNKVHKIQITKYILATEAQLCRIHC